MTNTNCLANMQCPKCESDGPFWIEGVAYFLVSDNGITEYGSVNWQDDSGCECSACHHRDFVAHFTQEKGE